MESVETPVVSVVIPNYNYACYLEERVGSVLAQSFQDFEIILLDDCSTDDSRAVIEKYRNHPKVRAIVYNDTNSGSPFSQWLKGAQMARGKYVWIAEADDSARPDFLGKMVGVLDAFPSAAIAISGSDCMDECGRMTAQSYDRWDKGTEWGENVTKFYHGRDYLIHNMYWACYVYNASCVLLRRDFFEKADILESTAMRNSGDWLFWSRVLSKHDIVEVREKLSYLRRHSRCVTFAGQRSGNIIKEDARVIREIEKMVNVGTYRRIIRHGELLKNVARMALPDKDKRDIVRIVKDVLGATRLEYIVERINKPLAQYFPFLITSRNDILK